MLSNKFVIGVKITATDDLKENDSPVKDLTVRLLEPGQKSPKPRKAIFFSNKPIILKIKKIGNPTKCKELQTYQETF